MNGGILNETARAVLEECSYLVIYSDELVIESGSQIGVGASGEVLLAKLRKPGQAEVDVAVKCVWAVRTLGDRQRFVVRFARELRVWASVRHRNVLPLIGFRSSANHEVAQLVSPFIANGNVIQYISGRNPGWSERLKLVEDIAAGVEFLHKHQPQICHADLKPANVLVSDSCDAILCDFGLASFVEMSGASSGLTTSRSVKGSIRYMSPELLLETTSTHTLASDVWAWACTAFEILTNRIPYAWAKKEPDIIIAVHRQEAPGNVGSILLVERVFGEGVSQTIRERDCATAATLLISRCWGFTPTERPTMQEIMDQVFPRQWEGQSLLCVDVVGRVHVRIKASINLNDLCVEIAGPWICVKLNGVCHRTGCCDTAQYQSILQHGDVDIEVDVDVHDFREFIVLEVRYSVNGIEKRTVGVVGIGVAKLARETSVSQLHRYVIQNPDGQIILQYDIDFSHSVRIIDSSGQLEGPAPRAFSTEGGRSFMGSGSEVSSGGTFHTARSNLSSDYQMSIPGGYRLVL